jgi:putative membrane protein
MKLVIVMIISLFLLATGSPAESAPAQNAGFSPAGKSFIKDASSAGLVEVELGQVARDKGSSQEVKAYGDRMILDHGKANEELKGIAEQKNVKLPLQVERKHVTMIAMLSKLSGPEFDRKYMVSMVKHHARNIARFKKAIRKVKDQDLKAWAAATLPVLQQHLLLAKELAGKLGAR